MVSLALRRAEEDGMRRKISVDPWRWYEAVLKPAQSSDAASQAQGLLVALAFVLGMVAGLGLAAGWLP